jgi:hypothetical protein
LSDADPEATVAIRVAEKRARTMKTDPITSETADPESLARSEIRIT